MSNDERLITVDDRAGESVEHSMLAE